MKKLLSIFTFILIYSSTYSQEMDTLKILTDNDWHTLNWLDKDTVCFISKRKIDTVYDGLSIKKKLNKLRRNIYGERICFDSGKLKYSYGLSCMVGESLRKINSIDYKNNKLIIDYQTKPWPWKDKSWIFRKREFEIIKWSAQYIVLK